MRKSLNAMKSLLALLVISVSITLSGCELPGKKIAAEVPKTDQDWKTQLSRKLPMFGHRNWILVVDKAFPEQNAAGMEYMYVDENLLPVLKHVLAQIGQSGHVKPIIYQDKELGFITESQAKGVEQFVKDSKATFGAQNVQTMLHDAVFKKLDAESKLFKVLVIKTNETIPYTSVFLQLDCAYWNGDKEKELRLNMR